MDLPRETLFVALTRPAVNRFGIPHKGWVLNLIATQLFVLWVGHGSFWYYSVGVIFHIALRMLTEWDHNFFRLIQLWLNTKMKARSRWQWGGSMLSPLPAGIPQDSKDVAGAV